MTTRLHGGGSCIDLPLHHDLERERFITALASDDATEFDDQYMRIAPQFEGGAGRYAWLAESLFLGRGRLTGPKAIEYELYRVV